jgi:hypothetical protein
MSNNFLPKEAIRLTNVYEVSVTPETASNWLEGQAATRPLSQRKIQRLAAQMKSGNWTATPCAVWVNEDGRILDGIHRLYAVVLSGQTVPMCVLVEPKQ